MISRTITSSDLSTRVQALRLLRATHLWLFDTEINLSDPAPVDDPRALLLTSAAVGCAPLPRVHGRQPAGLDDAVEAAFAALATELGVAGDPVARAAARRATFPAGACPHRVTSLDNSRHGVTVTVKGAVEAVLPHCTEFLDEQGRAVPLTPAARLLLHRAVERYTTDGCTVLAVAHRAVGVGRPAPVDRRAAETDLVLIGLVAMADPVLSLVTTEPPPPASCSPSGPAPEPEGNP